MAVKLKSKWNDLGTFESIEREAVKDKQGCTVIGSANYEKCKNTLFLTDTPDTALTAYGIENMIIISTKNNVLVVHKEKTREAVPLIDEVDSTFEKKIIVIQQEPVKKEL